MGKWRDSWSDKQRYKFAKEFIEKAGVGFSPSDSKRVSRWLEQNPKLANQIYDQVDTDTLHSPEVGAFGRFDYEPDEADAYDPDPALGFFKEHPPASRTPDLRTYPSKERQEKTGFFQRSAIRHGTSAPTDSGRKLGKEVLRGGRYQPNLFRYGQQVVSLDTETVGTSTTKGSILSIAAVRKAYNKDLNQWDVVSKFTRYYYPTKEDYQLTDDRGIPVYDQSVAISGLTNENIRSRRAQQLAKYSKRFNQKELTALMDYIGDAPVIGQNISQFDWPKLFGMATYPGFQLPQSVLPEGGLIDLYHLSAGTHGFGKGVNTLSSQFKRLFGKTPEQAGYTAHDALEDTQIAFDVFGAMLKSDKRYGRIARYVFNHGLSTKFRDNMIRGWTEVYGMDNEAQYNDLLDRTQGDDADFQIEDISSHGFDLQATGGGVSNSMAITEALIQLGLKIDSMRDAMGGFAATHTGVTNNSIVAQAAMFDDARARTRFLKTAFTSPAALEAAKERATQLNVRRRMLAEKAEQARAERAAQKASVQAYVSPKSEWGWSTTDSYVKMAAGQSVGGQDEVVLGSLKIFSDAIKNASQIVNTFASNFDKINNAGMHEAKGIYGAASYFIPGPLKGAGNRFFSSGLERWNELFLSRQKWLQLGGDVGGAVGNLLTGNFAGAITSGINAWGNYKTSSIKQWGQGVQSQINLWSGFTELMLAPIKLVASAFRNLGRITLRLGSQFLNVIKQFSSLGIPLTNLTGMTFADMQRSYVADNMIGASRGTTSGVLNGFANSQMELFTLGQVNTDRLVAAAMTGTFGSVYSNGGDTQEQYANTVNTLLAQIQSADPRSKQRLMMLAGKIDSTLPTTLQQLDNLSLLNGKYKDYNYLSSSQWDRDHGINRYTASQRQRARYTEIGMEYGALSDSMQNSLYRISSNLWDKFGKNLMSGVNEVLNLIADGKWGAAWNKVTSTLKGAWDTIKNMFAEGGLDLGKLKDGFINGLKVIVKGALPILGDLVAEYIKLASSAWAKIADAIFPTIDNLITRLSTVKFDIVKDESGFHIGVKTMQASNWQSASSSMLNGDDKSREWYKNALGQAQTGDGNQQMSWPDLLANGKMKVYRDVTTGKLQRFMAPQEVALNRNLRSEDIKLSDFTPEMWDSLLKQRPLELTLGKEKHRIDNYEEFQRVLPILETLRNYGIKVNDLSGNMAGIGYAMFGGGDISKYGILSNSLFKDKSLGQIIEELGKQASDAISAGARELSMQIVIKDDKGNEVEIDSNGENASVKSHIINDLMQLKNVTRKGIAIMGEAISG